MVRVGIFGDNNLNDLILSVNSILNNKFECKIIDFDVKKYSDCEKRIESKLDGFDVFLIISSLKVLFVDLEELLLKVQKCSNVSKNIIIVITYLGYLRQSDEVTLADKVLKLLLSFDSVKKIILVDPHRFNYKNRRIGVINTFDIFYGSICSICNFEDMIVLVPDSGAKMRNNKLLSRLGSNIIYCKKSRSVDGEIVDFGIDNCFYRENVVIIDDIIDTGKTLELVISSFVRRIKELGFACPNFYIFSTHCVFSVTNSMFFDKKYSIKIITTNSLNKQVNGVKYVDLSKCICKKLVSIISRIRV